MQSLEEECAEKELQCMALSEQVEKLKMVVSHFQNKLDKADSDADDGKQTKATEPSVSNDLSQLDFMSVFQCELLTKYFWELKIHALIFVSGAFAAHQNSHV